MSSLPIYRERLTVAERRELAESRRAEQVAELAKEILADHELLDDAVGDFGGELSFTAIYLNLTTIASCETQEQFATHGAALKEHLQAIAHWYADKLTPPVPSFLLPQAD